jgi:hypothetical protein
VIFTDPHGLYSVDDANYEEPQPQVLEGVRCMEMLLGVTLTITSGRRDGDTGMHGQGLAVDIRTRDNPYIGNNPVLFKCTAKECGFKFFLDERFPGSSPNWEGPHYHLDMREGGEIKGCDSVC